MKTTLFFLFGALLLCASCEQNSNEKSEEPEAINTEREAAEVYANCHRDMVLKREEMGSAESADELLELVAELEDLAIEATECERSWNRKYDGRIDIEKFKEELKAIDPKIHNFAEELGAF